MNFILQYTVRCALLAAMLLSTSLPAHDIHMAVFNLSHEADTLKLIATFDKHDLLNNTLHTSAEDEKLLDKINAYIGEQMQIKINDRDCAFAFDKVETSPLVLSVYAQAPFGESPKEILIQNSCMLAEVPRQENVFHFIMHGKTRSFRMDESRQEITVNY